MKPRSEGTSHGFPVSRELGDEERFYDDEETSQVRRSPLYDDGRASFDDLEQPAGVPTMRLRNVFWRVVGVAAIGAAVYGAAQIALRPAALRAMADWITLGHTAQLTNAEHAVKSWVDRMLHD
jgi:hypothetical protein